MDYISDLMVLTFPLLFNKLTVVVYIVDGIVRFTFFLSIRNERTDKIIDRINQTCALKELAVKIKMKNLYSSIFFYSSLG